MEERPAAHEGERYFHDPHFGGIFTRENVKAFLKAVGVLSPWEKLLSLPEGRKLAVREKDGKQFVFVLNYQKPFPGKII